MKLKPRLTRQIASFQINAETYEKLEKIMKVGKYTSMTTVVQDVLDQLVDRISFEVVRKVKK